MEVKVRGVEWTHNRSNACDGGHGLAQAREDEEERRDAGNNEVLHLLLLYFLASLVNVMHRLDGLLYHEDGHSGAVGGIRWILVAEPIDLDGFRLGAEKGGEVTDVPDGLANVLLRIGDLEIWPEL